VAVHAASTPGFIVNRCARPFYGEALRLLVERAASPATLDAVMREAGGFRMGPFELMDLIGLDVNFAVTRSVWEAYFHDPRYAPSILQQELVAAGFLGRKSGQGYFRYGPTRKSPCRRPRPSSPPRQGPRGRRRALIAALCDRLAASGFEIAHVPANAALAPCYFVVDGAILVPSDGRTPPPSRLPAASATSSRSTWRSTTARARGSPWRAPIPARTARTARGGRAAGRGHRGLAPRTMSPVWR
jgi:3-hydroxybutyryl-CoA dehydrogenase